EGRGRGSVGPAVPLGGGPAADRKGSRRGAASAVGPREGSRARPGERLSPRPAGRGIPGGRRFGEGPGVARPDRASPRRQGSEAREIPGGSAAGFDRRRLPHGGAQVPDRREPPEGDPPVPAGATRRRTGRRRNSTGRLVPDARGEDPGTRGTTGSALLRRDTRRRSREPPGAHDRSRHRRGPPRVRGARRDR